MVKKCARYNIGFGKIATNDGSVIFQLLLTIAVIAAGVFFRLNILQWTFLALLTSVFLVTGIYRSAAHILTYHDESITLDQAVRIKAMSNLIVMMTAGFTLFSYLIIFVPKINTLL
jgi:hypothetical protein